jgi:hypothetical protein
MAMTINLFIPGPVLGPNQQKKLGTRARMSYTTAQRSKAAMFAYTYMVNNKVGAITGPATVQFEVTRRRLLDPFDNLPAALKPLVDGLCDRLLLAGDGPKGPYRWNPPTQRQCKTKAEEGVNVTITTEEETT